MNVSLESAQNWQQVEALTAPGEQDHQLESGAQGKALLGVQTNLTLKTWAGIFVCLVFCLFICLFVFQRCVYRTANAQIKQTWFGNSQCLCLKTTPSYNNSCIKLCGTQGWSLQVAKTRSWRRQEGSMLGCKLLLCSIFGKKVFYSGVLLYITYLSVWVSSLLRRWKRKWLNTEQWECCIDWLETLSGKWS